ncbi:MAG: MoaD/ThiS family protein [Promethearchaeota archaeon]
MIQIKIKFFSLLIDFLGISELDISLNDNSSVKDLFGKLSQDFGKKFENIILTPQKTLNKFVILALNGKDIRSSDYFNIILQNGDEINFLPAIAGG